MEQPPSYRSIQQLTASQQQLHRQQQYGSRQLTKEQQQAAGLSASRQQLLGSQQLPQPQQQLKSEALKLGSSYNSVPDLAPFSTRQYAATETSSSDPYALDSDDHEDLDEDYLRPQIGQKQPPTAQRPPSAAQRQPPTAQRQPAAAQRQPPTAQRQSAVAQRQPPTVQPRQPPTGGDKLAYQSEIRSIIQSYHDLTGGLQPSGSSQSASEDEEDEEREDTRRLLRQPWRTSGADSSTDDGESTEYEWHDRRVAAAGTGGRHQDRPNPPAQNRGEIQAVGYRRGGTNNIVDQASDAAASPAESFRSQARRNASFKKAVSSHRLAGSLAEELARSMEELHQGFVSLSRAGSVRSLSLKSGLNSRTESMQSLTSRSSYR